MVAAAAPLPCLTLRPAGAADAAWFLRLRNDPLTRQHSADPDPIQSADHARWFARVLASPRHHLYVAEVGGQAVGTGRLDVGPYRHAEISLAIAPEARGQGYGTALVGALVAVAQQHGIGTLTARVKPTNPRSLACFVRHGFRAPTIHLELQV